MTIKTLGILGTGHLASYTVAGLRNKSDSLKILLSPRNHATAKSLEKNYRCEIAKNNQEVINLSDCVLLSVRPHQLDQLLDGLNFPPCKLVISAMAGVSIAQLEAYSNLSHSKIVRTLVNVSAEVNKGPVPLFPDNTDAGELLGRLGTLISFEDEAAFDIAIVHGCMHGWLYFWLDEMVSWTMKQGLDREQAENMIKQTVQGAIDLSDDKQATLNEIGVSIATEGTYTLAGLQQLQDSGALKAWSNSMQTVLGKLE